jgi:hypothetical protein
MIVALNENTATILAIDGINGLDIGADADGNFVFRLLVADPEDPPIEAPESIAGFGVVFVAGDPMLEAGIPDGARYEPLIGGIQIGRTEIIAGEGVTGTLGCVLRDLATGASVAISNAHVMCTGNPPTMQQPAPATDPAPGLETFGTVLRCEFPNIPPLFFPGLPSGFWDAAVCSIDSRTSTIGEVADLGVVTGISSPQLGDVVRKRGYRTGVTHGVVEGIFGSYLAKERDGTPKWTLVGQVCIALIPDLGLNPLGIWSDSGDSGSVVLNSANEIVAQHWGGDGNGRGYASDFSTLAIALGVGL